MNRLSSPTSVSSGAKGIRDMREWYISKRPRPGYIKRIFETQSEIGGDNFVHKQVGT
jgi:hypothetical protein